MNALRIMIVAGETSGDILAAELVEELRKAIAAKIPGPENPPASQSNFAPVFFGAGGSKMKAAGVDLAFDMTHHAVVGLTDVAKNYLKFKALFNQLVTLARVRQPDIIICVDFSGFNRRFAAAVKDGIRSHRGLFSNWSPKIVQYISPQVWASRPGRIYSMQRDFDMVLSIFPFEKEWYSNRVPKLRVEFIGHPIFDRYASWDQIQSSQEIPGLAKRVVLLPGSRASELKLHLPVMLGAWAMIQKQFPAATAHILLPNQKMTDLATGIVKNTATTTTASIQTGGLPDALKVSDLAIASTGTVTMECAYFRVPAVTMYKTSFATYQIGRQIVNVKSLTMPNLLANETVYPEFIQNDATPIAIANAAIELLRSDGRSAVIRRKLDEIMATLRGKGAASRAAALILSLRS